MNRQPPLFKCITRDLLLTGFLFLLAALARAHESPVDHVEREVRLWVEGNRLHFSYRVQQSERSVLMQLHKMDGNADGNISDTERDAFFTAHAARLAGLFRLELDGRTLKLAPLGSVRLDPRLGQTFLFTAPLPNLPPGLHAGHLIDDNSRAYPGPFRWISAGEGVGKATRVEPLVPPEGRQTSTHTAWMTLNFQIAVPE